MSYLIYYRNYWRVLSKKKLAINPSHINHLSNARNNQSCRGLLLHIVREFGLEINIGAMGIQIRYGECTDDC